MVNLYERLTGEIQLNLSAKARRDIDVLPIEGQKCEIRVDNFIYRCTVKSVDSVTKSGNFIMTFEYERVENIPKCPTCNRRYL